MEKLNLKKTVYFCIPFILKPLSTSRLFFEGCQVEGEWLGVGCMCVCVWGGGGEGSGDGKGVRIWPASVMFELTVPNPRGI